MKTELLVQLFEKLEALATRLPAGIQKPLLQELVPLREIFLQSRPPRLAIAGGAGPETRLLVQRIFGGSIQLRIADPAATDLSGWELYEREGGAQAEVFDARFRAWSGIVTKSGPDICLLVHAADAFDEALVRELEKIEAMLLRQAASGQPPTRVVALLTGAVAGTGDEARLRFHTALLSRKALEPALSATFLLGDGPDVPDQLREDLVNYLFTQLPHPARLEYARFSKSLPAQQSLAQILTRSVTAMCGAIGTQPIPLADLPILTSLQGGMVAALIYVSGRPFSLKLAAEFLGSLGANLGLGIALRETSRAVLKFLPGWGNVVSGAIAAAGTLAIGRGAVAYFIEGKSLPAAHQIFKRKPKKNVPTLLLEDEPPSGSKTPTPPL